MKTTVANIRGTFFTSKPVEIDYDKALKIVGYLRNYELFPFPVNGFSFQIGPGGMIPTTLNSYEFRNSNNSLNISIGPDRIDVNNCQGFDNIEESFNDIVGFLYQTINAFQSCSEFKITRLALASTWILAKENLANIGSQLLHEDHNNSIIEWENRRVERRPLASIEGILVNYGHKLARGYLKLPIEQALSDRIFFETDINTVPLQPGVLDHDKTAGFFENAIKESSDMVIEYLK